MTAEPGVRSHFSPPGFATRSEIWGSFHFGTQVSVSLKWRLSSHVHELELWTICMNPFSGLPWWLRR